MKHVRRLDAEERYRLTEVDRQVIETDLGEFEVHEGKLCTTLDCPMMDEEEEKGEDNPNSVNLKKVAVKSTMCMSKTGTRSRKVIMGRHNRSQQLNLDRP